MHQLRDDIDPLDTSNPVDAAWQRFRSRYAAARLLDWLLADVEHRHPEYFQDLYYRFQTAWDHAETLKRDQGYDGWVPLPELNSDRDFLWVSERELSQLQEELFPHGSHDAPRMDAGTALVVVTLYSALESLARELSLFDSSPSKSMVRCLDEELGLKRLDPDAFALLVDLRETRNLIAHHGGVVNARYRTMVPHTSLENGEDRIVSRKDIGAFARTAYWAAGLAYRSVTG